MIDQGFGVATALFGRGWSRVGRAQRLPVLVADIVRSIVELGHNLGLTTVAEGIEDQATWDRLSALGCDVAQGYFLCRPLPADQLERWFDSVAATVPAPA